jgi:broad-specificity NMP kinase
VPCVDTQKFSSYNLAVPPERLYFPFSLTHHLLTMRNLPNIIITGTPGVGKTTTCEQLVSLSSSSSLGLLHHLSINTLAKDRSCHEGFDEDMKTYIVDEDKLLDEVEKEVEEGEGEGGWLIDWHACDLFPKSWVDLVVVLRCERTDILWDRLKARYV